MILVILIALPVCVELAGWLVDAIVTARIRNDENLAEPDEWT